MLPNDEDHVDDGDDNHDYYDYDDAHYGDKSDPPPHSWHSAPGVDSAGSATWTTSSSQGTFSWKENFEEKYPNPLTQTLTYSPSESHPPTN